MLHAQCLALVGCVYVDIARWVGRGRQHAHTYTHTLGSVSDVGFIECWAHYVSGAPVRVRDVVWATRDEERCALLLEKRPGFGNMQRNRRFVGTVVFVVTGWQLPRVGGARSCTAAVRLPIRQGRHYAPPYSSSNSAGCWIVFLEYIYMIKGLTESLRLEVLSEGVSGLFSLIHCSKKNPSIWICLIKLSMCSFSAPKTWFDLKF